MAEPVKELPVNQILCGDCPEVMREWPDGCVDCCVSSPPYWGLRDYGVEGQLGLEPTPEEFVEKMVEIFREVRRVLKDEGTLWLNLGDSYAGGKMGRADKHENGGGLYNGVQRGWEGQVPKQNTVPPGLKPKDLCGIPWRVAFALQADGWYLRQDIIWSKPNPMPESVTDRCTKAHEYIFLLSKKAKYYYDADAVREPQSEASLVRYGYGFNTVDMKPSGERPNTGESIRPNPNGRNRRSVWHIATQACPEAHFATYPEKLIEPCILAGCPKGGVVLDPFGGSGTTGIVAAKNKRDYVLIELNEQYVEEIAKPRLAAVEIGVPVKEARAGQMALFGE